MSERVDGCLVASDLDEGFASLSTRYSNDGYLFFRAVLDRAEVDRVREDFVSVLRDVGALVPGAPDSAWSGMPQDAIDDEQLYRCSSYQDLCESPTTLGVLERVFGQPVYVFKGTTIRYATPGQDVYTTPPIRITSSSARTRTSERSGYR